MYFDAPLHLQSFDREKVRRSATIQRPFQPHSRSNALASFHSLSISPSVMSFKGLPILML